MSDNGKHEIIIVRHGEEEEHEEHHSSTWKVAHADFMTAMMAFFLIMWLINVTDQDVRKALAQYFNPVNIGENIMPRRGVNDPKNAKDEGTSDDGTQLTALKNTQGAALGQGDDLQQGARERALFQDPYASLAALAATAKQPAPLPREVAMGDVGSPGTGTGDAQRDPFDPAYWQTASASKPIADLDVKPYAAHGGTSALIRSDGSNRDLPGRAGGTDPEPTTGKAQVRDPADMPGQPAPTPVTAAAASAAASLDQKAAAASGKATDQVAKKIQAEINAVIKSTIGTQNAPHVDVRATNEGLLINLTDDANFSMFDIGSAQPDPRLVRAMEKVAKILSGRPGEVVIRGYTDGRPYRSDIYDNWRLSTARAHMAYYMLVRGGLEEKRIGKIEGLADRHLKAPADPYAPENRRIEILVREPMT